MLANGLTCTPVRGLGGVFTLVGLPPSDPKNRDTCVSHGAHCRQDHEPGERLKPAQPDLLAFESITEKADLLPFFKALPPVKSVPADETGAEQMQQVREAVWAFALAIDQYVVAFCVHQGIVAVFRQGRDWAGKGVLISSNAANQLIETAMADTNVLSKDVEIKGSLRFQTDLFLDGKVEGEILATGSLTVGANAEIKGEIRARSVSILGKVNGNVIVQDRCELKANAQLVGDLHAPRLVIEEGATFVGKSEVNPGKAQSFKPEVVRSESGAA